MILSPLGERERVRGHSEMPEFVVARRIEF